MFETKLKYWAKKDVETSPAEQIIIYILQKWRIPYLREVEFADFKSPKGGYYRYDFYIPSRNIIIEYDGKKWHKDKTKDDIKNEFCKKHSINLIRFSSKHYYKLEKNLKRVLKIK